MKRKHSLWADHRDAFASGLIRFVIMSAFLIWPMLAAPL